MESPNRTIPGLTRPKLVIKKNTGGTIAKSTGEKGGWKGESTWEKGCCFFVFRRPPSVVGGGKGGEQLPKKAQRKKSSQTLNQSPKGSREGESEKGKGKVQ